MATAVLPIPRTMTPGRALRVFFLALAGLLAGCFVAALAVALIATTFFDYRVLTIRSDSMAPALGTGDVIVVRPGAINAAAPGDIVLFASGGDRIPTVHRVAGINEVELRVTDRQTNAVEVFSEHRLVTKGDANELADQGEVTGDEYLGEVWFTVPWGSHVSGLPLQYAFLGVLGATCIAWIAWEIRQQARRSER